MVGWRRLQSDHMARFKIGDQVRVLRNAARKGEIGTVIDVLPTMTFVGRSESYLVQFNTAKGPVAEHYPSHELYIPMRITQTNSRPSP
jgi:hypothetical protein